MNRAQYENAKATLQELKNEMARTDLTNDERTRLETLASQLSGSLLSSWVPFDWPRRIIMMILIFIGIYGLLNGSYLLLLCWPIAAVFSPRVVGEAALLLGKASLPT